MCSLSTNGVFSATFAVQANESTFVAWSWLLKRDETVVSGNTLTTDTINGFDFSTINGFLSAAGEYELCLSYLSECDGEQSELTAECSFTVDEELCNCSVVQFSNVDFTTGVIGPCSFPTVEPITCVVNGTTVTVTGGAVSDPTNSATGVQAWTLTQGGATVLSGSGVPSEFTGLDPGIYVIEIRLPYDCEGIGDIIVGCGFEVEQPFLGEVIDNVGELGFSFASEATGTLDPLANDNCGPNAVITNCREICPVTGEPNDVACSECNISADGKTIEFTGHWLDAGHTITYEYTVNDPAGKTDATGLMEVSVAFKAMKQFLMQVTTAEQMAELQGAGWEWGFHSFGDLIANEYGTATDPSGMTGYLAVAGAAGAEIKVSIKPNWFTGTSLNAVGQAAVNAIQTDHAGAQVLCGMHMEEGDFSIADAQAAQANLSAALTGPENALLGGYQSLGGRDHYDRLWMPLRDFSAGDFGVLNEIVERRHDPYATFPVQSLLNHGPTRTEDCKPKAGVKTGGFMGQVAGKLLPTPACEFTAGSNATNPACTPTGSVDNVWDATDGFIGTSSTDLTNFIRPGRGHFDSMIWTAHRICAIHMMWFTSTNNSAGSPLSSGNTLNQHSPDNFADLVHVLKKYEQGPKSIFETWPTDYRLRNHFVTVSQAGSA